MRTEDRGIPVTSATTIESPRVVPTQSSSQQQPLALSGGATAVRYLFFAVLSSAGLGWDLWSKWKVFHELRVHGQQPVWKGTLLGVPIEFELATTFNHGALWGIGQNQTWLFASLSFLAVAVIGYFLFNRQAIATWWLTIASGLLLAGTLGNLYDRLGLHAWTDGDGKVVYAVRDFLDFVFFNGAFHWATFNFADTYLVTGAIMLVLQSFWTAPAPSAAKSVAA